ncbi:MAG: hypothetical protein ABSE82_03495 [Nitrososphaerales archaeon]|jgi:nucleoside-triphosphatase THEP1
MNPVTVSVQISDDIGKLDPKKLRSAQRKVRDLISKKRPVIVTVEQGKAGNNYLEIARRYSRDVSDVKREIRKTNCLLVITALRAAKVPTHTQPFQSTDRAKAFLNNKIAAAVV